MLSHMCFERYKHFRASGGLNSFIYPGRWNKLVQKPFEDGDERGLVLLKAILRPLMLRRTKDTTDKDGR